MPQPRLKMGQVGDRTPPPGLSADLQSFDPDLRLRWNVREQCWMVVQKVRRRRHAGRWDEIEVYEAVDDERPVLFVLDAMGEPDRRILPQLWQQRAAQTKKDRIRRARERMAAKKKAKQAKVHDAYEDSREGLEKSVYQLQRKGHLGGSAYFAPKGGWDLGQTDEAT